ncbi:aminoglycoside phosphotransferase family protein [Candidatus Nitrosacidococcus tergens]|uniref:Aminoglycoside phosphotransferase n=1 Tax=Candidatus Nitrosacidococcus tergens TaxID=553981 RepID=A0A7G1QB21_9GAMM|nr:phosphotransferase [Candidatus Nitrosacidococcus tergens]CAB1276715.1 Aminoglycoside phosphotransferase [Candidatus Nitrosacidococcus tergens]
MHYSLTPVAGDASARRYFRLFQPQKESLIIMDAPPEKEGCTNFIYIANKLNKLGLNVPRILSQDLAQGFLLLTDLGSDQYLDFLNVNSAQTLYEDAISALLILQSKGTNSADLRPYSRKLLLQEMELFKDWYLGCHLGIQMTTELDSIFNLLVNIVLNQPQVFVHRDYHSRNLMITNQNNPGILDFQDAVKGPVTYDLVSLLRDCYIAWPQEKIAGWVSTYRNKAAQLNIPVGQDLNEFLYWFDWMGIQRHLKAIGIFARLNYRDHKPNYLKDIPRTLAYIIRVGSQYNELVDLNKILQSLPQSDMVLQ